MTVGRIIVTCNRHHPKEDLCQLVLIVMRRFAVTLDDGIKLAETTIDDWIVSREFRETGDVEFVSV